MNANKLASPRWVCKNVDTEHFEEVIKWYSACYKDTSMLEQSAAWIRRVMTDASDIVMKRIVKRSGRKQASWWNENIEEAGKLPYNQEGS